MNLQSWDDLRALSRRQFGLFTTAHAAQHGIDTDTLQRCEQTGALWQAHYGVYAFTADATDMFTFESWAAQWLALRPDADVEERRAAPDCILSHETAAVIQELGTVVSHILVLTAPHPIPVGQPQMHTHQRPIGLPNVDWHIVEGLPVATPGKVIADLARDHYDGSHQGTVIADILDSRQLDLPEIGLRLNPFAHQWRQPDGVALARLFLAAAQRSPH